MRYLDEFRDAEICETLLAEIKNSVTKDWVLMEICGGQTHSILQYGIDQLLPKEITLVHGPGCPVCVTPIEIINQAIQISKMENVIFTSFGDMLRVPGSDSDLFKAKSEGADIRIVYSPLEAVKLAKNNPEKQVVFFAIGFETTAPGNAMAIMQAHREVLKNFSALVSHVLVPPAVKAIVSSPANKVNGLIAAGHVCTVMGYREYELLAEEFTVPIVPTGFEPVDLLEGILTLIQLLEKNEAKVVNQYKRVVTRDGNKSALQMINEIFEVTDRKWRGIGSIPASGWKIKENYKMYDASLKFKVDKIEKDESELCISGLVLQGLKKPSECPAFGKECNPVSPLGATMVSNEGACAAYYKYHSLNRV